MIEITEEGIHAALGPYFEGHYVVFDPGLQGQKISGDGRVVIGDRAGPTRHPTTLAHQMAHFVEIDRRRMAVYDWGLRSPLRTIAGHLVCEPRTRAMTERELRCTAIQWNIGERLGLPDLEKEMEDQVRALLYLPDWWLVPGESDKAKVNWLRRRAKALRRKYPFAWFESEWWERSQVLWARHRRRLRATRSRAGVKENPEI